MAAAVLAVLLAAAAANPCVAQDQAGAPGAKDRAALDRAIDALLNRPSAPDLFGLTTVKLGSTIFDDVWREASSSVVPRGDNQIDALVARLSAMPLRERAAAANAWVNAHIAYAPDLALSSRQQVSARPTPTSPIQTRAAMRRRVRE